MNIFQALLLDFKAEKIMRKDCLKQLSRQNDIFENNFDYYQSINTKK